MLRLKGLPLLIWFQARRAAASNFFLAQVASISPDSFAACSIWRCSVRETRVVTYCLRFWFLGSAGRPILVVFPILNGQQIEMVLRGFTLGCTFSQPANEVQRRRTKSFHSGRGRHVIEWSQRSRGFAPSRICRRSWPNYLGWKRC